MANDFSADSNCVALYNFESGALTTDSKGTNTLTDVNTVATSATCKQGSASADFEASNGEYLYRTDANLSAGFPWKSGSSNNQISICGWFQCEANFAATGYLIAKYTSDTNKKSLVLYRSSADQSLRLGIGHTSGATLETTAGLYTLANGRWYHVGFTIDRSTKAWTLRLWDDTAQSVVANTSGTWTNTPSLVDAPFVIGANAAATPANFWDGLVDEVVVFNDILAAGEIDQIRQGIYGAGGGGGYVHRVCGVTPVKVCGVVPVGVGGI